MWRDRSRQRVGVVTGTRSGWGRRIGIGSLVLVSGIFSFLNAGERVTIDVGFTVLYRVSLVGLVFSVFLLGMVTMFLFGLRQDRQMRTALRQREQLFRAREPHRQSSPPPPPPPSQQAPDPPP